MSDAVAGVYSEHQKTLQSEVPANGALAIIYNPTTKAAFMQPISADMREGDNDLAALSATLRAMKSAGTPMTEINATIVTNNDAIKNATADTLKHQGIDAAYTNQDGLIKLYLKNGNFVQEAKQEQQQEFGR